ncbi:MAG: ribokinase [Pseudobutyrivibrio sp.]|nr:ribokinase [Pseudobutyrivibrio sp.]
MKVLNFGSLNLDYNYTVSHIVREGETTSASQVQVNLGGKGFNQSVALAKAGISIYHAGLVGEEGIDFYDTCQDVGIKTDFLKTVIGRCGHSIIQVDGSGQNSIILYGGANRKNTKEYVDEVLSNFSFGDVILLQNEISEVPYIIEQAFKKGMTIVLNPSPYDEVIEQCDLGKVSMFILNEIEGQQITGMTTPSTIVTALEASFPNAKIVLTLGEKGAIYHLGDDELYQPAFVVDVVDTTAAGDTFTGYFVAGLIKQYTVRDSLIKASKAAAIAVTKQGAAKSIPFMSEVELFEN